MGGAEGRSRACEGARPRSMTARLMRSDRAGRGELNCGRTSGRATGSSVSWRPLRGARRTENAPRASVTRGRGGAASERIYGRGQLAQVGAKRPPLRPVARWPGLIDALTLLLFVVERERRSELVLRGLHLSHEARQLRASRASSAAEAGHASKRLERTSTSRSTLSPSPLVPGRRRYAVAALHRQADYTLQLASRAREHRDPHDLAVLLRLDSEHFLPGSRLRSRTVLGLLHLRC